nr:glycine cleavage system aminomethyltransferase GcvT [Pararhizobium sp. IMCC3301]
MKHTPLYDLHLESGAKMGAFAGYEMPLFYPLGLMKEHLHTRKAAGLFDISHMMHVEVTGAQASALIERLYPYVAGGQDLKAARYTFLLNENAGIIDDLIITRLGAERFLIVANAGCAEKDLAHIQSQAANFDAVVQVIPRGFLALQGPDAEAVLQDRGFAVSQMNFMTGIEPKDGWFLSRTGYTGEDGFEIAMPEPDCAGFARDLLADERVMPVGLGARDSLRLEAGLSLYGQDLSDTISPHEAGLIWAIPKELRTGGAYIGAAALADKIESGRARMRVGLSAEGRMPVRAGANLQDETGKSIGVVTSGGYGPTIERGVALGLISVDAVDAAMFADVRGKIIPMQKVKLPFVPHQYKPKN